MLSLLTIYITFKYLNECGGLWLWAGLGSYLEAVDHDWGWGGGCVDRWTRNGKNRRLSKKCNSAPMPFITTTGPNRGSSTLGLKSKSIRSDDHKTETELLFGFPTLFSFILIPILSEVSTTTYKLQMQVVL